MRGNARECIRTRTQLYPGLDLERISLAARALATCALCLFLLSDVFRNTCLVFVFMFYVLCFIFMFVCYTCFMQHVLYVCFCLAMFLQHVPCVCFYVLFLFLCFFATHVLCNTCLVFVFLLHVFYP